MQYTEEELQKILDKHKLWLSNEGGKRANLSSADLRCADLSNADLYRADLRCADLSNADLYRADLSNADLCRADLSHADLRYADLTNANLRGADLSNVNLSDTNLSGANLSYATFDNTLILGKPVNKEPVQLCYSPYLVLITDTMMQIGCQVHSIDEWLAFTVDEIEYMDGDAKWFYKNYGELIKEAVLSHRVLK